MNRMSGRFVPSRPAPRFSSTVAQNKQCPQEHYKKPSAGRPTMPPFTHHEIPQDILRSDTEGASAIAPSIESPVARVGQRVANSVLMVGSALCEPTPLATHTLSIKPPTAADPSAIPIHTVCIDSLDVPNLLKVCNESYEAGPVRDTALVFGSVLPHTQDEIAVAEAMVRAVDYVVIDPATDSELYTLKTDCGIPPLKMVLVWKGAASAEEWRKHGVAGFFASTDQAYQEITSTLPPFLFRVHPSVLRERINQRRIDLGRDAVHGRSLRFQLTSIVYRNLPKGPCDGGNGYPKVGGRKSGVIRITKSARTRKAKCLEHGLPTESGSMETQGGDTGPTDFRTISKRIKLGLGFFTRPVRTDHSKRKASPEPREESELPI